MSPIPSWDRSGCGGSMLLLLLLFSAPVADADDDGVDAAAVLDVDAEDVAGDE